MNYVRYIGAAVMVAGAVMGLIGAFTTRSEKTSPMLIASPVAMVVGFFWWFVSAV
jgi:hypothetical protein